MRNLNPLQISTIEKLLCFGSRGSPVQSWPPRFQSHDFPKQFQPHLTGTQIQRGAICALFVPTVSRAFGIIRNRRADRNSWNLAYGSGGVERHAGSYGGRQRPLATEGPFGEAFSAVPKIPASQGSRVTAGKATVGNQSGPLPLSLERARHRKRVRTVIRKIAGCAPMLGGYR